MRPHQYQYSLRLLLLGMTLSAVALALLAYWIDGARKQRRAVKGLESLDGCTILYDFQSYPCTVPSDQPSWLENFLARDYVHSVVIVCLPVEQIESAAPLLSQMTGLQEIRLFVHDNDDEHDRRLNAAIDQLRTRFPHLKVEEAGQCPILTSVTPVVG